MRVERLAAEQLRCFEALAFEPGPGMNWLIGDNGAGKSTVLEAIYLLSRGRSFRSGGRASPCRSGFRSYLVHATLTRGPRTGLRLGLQREDDQWRARLDGANLTSLAPLFEACPVVYFGPESAALIVGQAEERRAFLDWSVFHVEHASLQSWRVWRRALRQRNALLREQAADSAFEPWERELVRAAERIHARRSDCLASLAPYFAEETARLVPELGPASLDYRPGWDLELGLARQFAEQRGRERERGYTRHGPHRADWLPRFTHVAQREHLSRGQAKAIALACVLAQTRWLQAQLGEFPLLCLDDLDSELDGSHAERVVAWLAGQPLQVWLTATAIPDCERRGQQAQLFHVEHAGIHPITTGG